jgi:16S rRNA (cytosine967-C5)-methyltransferase
MLTLVAAPARQIATWVLYRVVHDEAWAAPTLDAELKRASASRQDAALATQIVYGTLRSVPELEAALSRYARRPIKVDDWSRAALLGAAFQLLHLGRVPSHAVVNDTVELVRTKRGARVAGFANALLRKLSAEGARRPVHSAQLGVPPWLHHALLASLGEERTRRLLEIDDEGPSIDLRVRADLDRETVAEAIERARPEATVAFTELSPLGLRVRGAGNPRSFPGYERGAFAVQEEGAQLIGLLLGASPGERVLDACAGRGGKTAQLMEAVGTSGGVVATDLHEHRLEQIDGELERLRLGAEGVQTACVDWTRGAGPVRGPLDRALVDAPCTGLGTLRRRPEILLRSNPTDPAHMGDVQRSILRNVAALVRPGGTLVYAVCSPLCEEGLDVVDGLDLPGLELWRDRGSSLKSLGFGPDGRLLLGPWVAGAGAWADAYQVFMWAHVG